MFHSVSCDTKVSCSGPRNCGRSCGTVAGPSPQLGPLQATCVMRPQGPRREDGVAPSRELDVVEFLET